MRDAQETWQAQLGGRYQSDRAVLFRDRIRRPAAWASRRPVRSIARPISWSISILVSSTSFAPGSARRAISRRPTCSRTRSVTTCSASRASRARCASCSSRAPISRMRCRCGSSCRRTASPASGANTAAQSGRAAQGKVELEAGDVEEGLNAAAAIGDDRIQRMSGGRVAPDRFTHGSSEQRVDLVPPRPALRRHEGLRYISIELSAHQLISCQLAASHAVS